MGLVIDLLHAFGGDVGVNLRGGKTAMAKQFLHAAQVSAVVEQMGGEAVAEFVRSGFHGNAGSLEIFLQDIRNGAGAQSRASFTNEQRAFVDAGFLTVALQGGDGVATQWAQAYFLAFAQHPQGIVVNVVVLHIQIDEFVKSQTCGVKGLEKRLAAGGGVCVRFSPA